MTFLTLLRFWREGAIGVLAITLAVFWWQWGITENNLDNERIAHRFTIAQYIQAQTEAELEQANNLLRVSEEQRLITERITDDYEIRIRNARITADILRSQLTEDRSVPRATSLPGLPDTPVRVDGSASIDGLSLNIDERLQCTESSIRLEGLQTWTLEQSQVPVNQPIGE